jgi:hypothetical protein
MNVFRARPTLSLYLLLIMLGVATYFGGTHGVQATRLVYLAGCVGVAFQALRFGTAYHFESLVVLFGFSPYLRRIVDYGCGFDAHGVMLSGPLLAALLPTIALPAAVMAKRAPHVGRLVPYVLAAICLGYAVLITVLNGGYVGAITGFGKSASVLFYGCWLLAKAEDPQQVMRQGARAFALVIPIVSVYGVMQYFNPSPADSYWMTATALSSIGVPEPEQVRVFSTLNSPASFGSFLVFGLMLVGFIGSRWQSLICFAPGSIALLLSESRTEWLALAASILYLLFYETTKLRSIMLSIGIVVVGVFAVFATPVGDELSNRLQTISNHPSEDASAQARLGELVVIFNNLDNYLIGSGISGQGGTGWGYNTQGTAVSDGLIVMSINSMGIFFGLLFNFSVIWAGVQGLLRINRRSAPEFVVAAGLVAGELLTIPLVNPTDAEFGIFFWTAVAIATRTPPTFQVLWGGSGLSSPNIGLSSPNRSGNSAISA